MGQCDRQTDRQNHKVHSSDIENALGPNLCTHFLANNCYEFVYMHCTK